MIDNQVDITRSKLNILCFLEMVAEPVLERMLEMAMIESDLMDYFSLKAFLNELEEESFVRSILIVDKKHYAILPRGSASLQFFSDRMLGSERERISNFVQKNIHEIHKLKEIVVDSRKTESAQYEVEIHLLEKNHPYFKMKLEVPSKESADRIVENWKENSSELYVDIMNQLLQKNGGKHD